MEHMSVSKRFRILVTKDPWAELRPSGQHPMHRKRHSAVAVEDRIFIIGGKASETLGKDSMWVLTINEIDPNREMWEEVQLSDNRVDLLSRHTAVVDEQVMCIFGGVEGETANNWLHAIDLRTLRCERIAQGSGFWPPPMDSHSAVLGVRQGVPCMLVFGGYVQGVPSNSVFSLQISTWTWNLVSTSGDQPSPRAGHSAVVYEDNMYIYGGETTGDVKLGDLWMFRPATDSWREILAENPPDARFGHTACVYSDAIFVFGGTKDFTNETNEVLKFSVRTNVWTVLQEEKEVNDPIRVLSGPGNPGQMRLNLGNPKQLTLPKAVIPDVKFTGHDSPVPAERRAVGRLPDRVPYPRTGHSAVVIRNKMYLFGGEKGEVPFNDIFAFELGSE